MSVVFVEQAPVITFECAVSDVSEQDLMRLDTVLAKNPLAFVLRAQIDTYDDFLDLSRLVADRTGGGEVDDESPAIVGKERSALHVDGTQVTTYWQGHHTRRESVASSAFRIAAFRFSQDEVALLRRYEESIPNLEGNPRDYSRYMSSIERLLGHLPTTRTAVGGVCHAGSSLFFRNGFDALTLTEAEEVPFHEFWSVDSEGKQIYRERQLFLSRIM